MKNFRQIKTKSALEAVIKVEFQRNEGFKKILSVEIFISSKYIFNT
jgi:hypothetical protein